MTDILSYADALKILGCKQTRLAKIAEFAATVALTGWATAGVGRPATGLLDLRSDVVRHTEDAVRRTTGRTRGGNRFSRTRRLAAAHAAIIVSAYFEALGEARLPVKLEQLDHVRHAGSGPAESFAVLAQSVLLAPLPMPEPHRPYAETRQAVRGVYERMTRALTAYARGLPVWAELSAGDRTRLPILLDDGPAAQALRIYDEDYRLLSLDSPEFGMWSLVTEAQPLGAGLSRVARLLAELAPPRVGDRPMIHLVRLAATALDQPLMAGGTAPEDVTLPLLGEGYISPRCRVAEMTREATPAARSWWAGQRGLPDAEAFLVGHLTSLGATQAPLVVLGEPGSGKSKLTEVLAARLAGSEFLPIRVELGDVMAESTVPSQTVISQIDQGLRNVLGEEVRFEDLIGAGDGALPVVMLDGFDELIQAVGAARYDYLEQIREFQIGQYRAGRPVAVIVTGRTVVADQVRFPEGVLALQLQPFEEDQVRRWLDIWDQTNRAVLARHDRTPLAAEVALTQGELATQPLLLLLLALYDATGNTVRRDGAPIGRAQLYESLIRDFAQREVAKDATAGGLPPARLRALVDRELVQLGVVALSMFARGRPVATEAALDRDLAALCGQARDPGGGVNWARRATRRFFFVHRTETGPADDRVRCYEFLHPTFGEFLVGWLAVYAVRELVRRHELTESELAAAPAQDIDDDLLHAVISFSCLAERGPTVGFAVELMAALPAELRTQAAGLLGTLLRESLHERRRRSFTGFEPARHPVTRRLAAYSANLTLLYAAASGEPVRVSRLLRDPDHLTRWTSYAHLWRSQLGDDGWAGLLAALPARRVSEGGERDILLGGAGPEPAGLSWWFDHRPPQKATVLRHRTRALAERPYLLSADTDLLADLLGGEGEPALVLRPSGEVTSAARLVSELLAGEAVSAGQRVALYLDAIAAVTAPNTPGNGRLLGLIAHAVTMDGGELPFADRGRILSELLHGGTDHAQLRPLVESMIAERFESWESLVQAGIPEDVLRKIHSP
ncbi:NACHT domain-containing protein [Nonomuraea sp. LPB2021202275-12-8]|uniref:NACHT domain-containing protein n=1 Tax=Nonomuraea sp. LPB2021202275-12-8 TaxID=3120159 RepID=UPI00300C86B4